MMTTTWRAARPDSDEFASFYAGYISKVPDGDIVETLASQITGTAAFLRSLPESQGDHRYGPGKWSIREVIGHMTDAERVFAYRAMRFSRGDETPVPGFDENFYVANSTFGARSIGDLASEFEHVRHATVHMLRGLDEAAMTRRGTANGNAVSVRALAFILAGHERHHLEILRTRYL
jgi:hypothetical protein